MGATLSNRKHTGHAGFTLIELMIVVLIIATVAAMAIPGFLSWNENERVRAAARSVADAFLLARSEAIRTGNNHLIVFGNALGAPNPIVIVNDGPPATANCAIDAGELVFEVPPTPDVSWGSVSSLSNGAKAPGDNGVGTVTAGWSFRNAGPLPADASWVLFQSDGIPRAFTPASPGCTTIGNAGEGGGGIYLTNTKRDYAIVLQPLGTTKIHRWDADASGWSN